MSNGINAPYGLKAVESVSGSGATRKMKSYRIVSQADGATNSTAIYKGDPVKFSTQGPRAGFATGMIVNALTPNPNNAAAVTPGGFLGTFIGCQYKRKGDIRITESDYLPAGLMVDVGTNITIFINDDPSTIFKVQMSTSDSTKVINLLSSTIFQDWMVGQNANLQLGGIPFDPLPNGWIQNPSNGSDINGSAVYLDGSTISIANAGGGNPTFDVKIIGLAPSSNNEMVAASALVNNIGLIPGQTLPFCDLLVKFNNHVYGSQGTPGPYNANV